MATPTPDYVDRFEQDWAAVRPELPIRACAPLLRLIRIAGHLHELLVARLAPRDLTPSQFVALATLRRRHPTPLSATDLRDAAILTSGSMTALLDRLEARGLVKRKPDPDDRRALRVSITPAGLDAIEPAVEERVADLAELAATIAARDLVATERALRGLLEHLEPTSGAP